MCGICGFIKFAGNVSGEDRHIVQKMNERLIHRGPDEQNSMFFDNVALGFTRLSIIGLGNGMQPIGNEDDSVFVLCNGEIFNYIELREELRQKGHSFKTESDVEVIVHLYEEYGIQFINKMNGQFAFALFDKKTNSMFCARGSNGHHSAVLYFYKKHIHFCLGD